MAHRNAAPFSDAGPALNAKVGGDLLLFRHRLQCRIGELRRILDKSTNSQAVVGEVIRHHRVKFGGIRHRAVGPKVRRDVFFGKLTGWIPGLSHTAKWPGYQLADSLYEARVTQREGRSPPPSRAHQDKGGDENLEAAPRTVIYPRPHHVQVGPCPRDEYQRHVRQDK